MFLLGGLKKSNLFYIDSEHLHQWMERSIATILLCIHTFLFTSRYGKKRPREFLFQLFCFASQRTKPSLRSQTTARFTTFNSQIIKSLKRKNVHTKCSQLLKRTVQTQTKNVWFVHFLTWPSWCSLKVSKL